MPIILHIYVYLRAGGIVHAVYEWAGGLWISNSYLAGGSQVISRRMGSYIAVSFGDFKYP